MATSAYSADFPTSHAAFSPSPCLYVWVIGNPTSGGRRGGVMLGRIAKLFQKTYGAEAVQETKSSQFLSLAFPSHTSASLGTSAAAASATSNGTFYGNKAHTSVLDGLPSLEAIWASGAAPFTATAGPTPPITPPASPPAAAATSVVNNTVEVRTLLIHTDQGGHAKPVCNALSRLILRSRLEDQQWRHQNNVNKSHSEGLSATRNSSGAEGSAQKGSAWDHTPRTQHVVLVVGGDGTLSEAVNGLCEGTLSGYKHFISGSFKSEATTTTRNANTADHRSPFHSSHAHVEQEAVVFAHLLPALLYVPGGTGADFAKLGLCCPTPEAALHVVRDGLVKLLFHTRRGDATSTEAATGNSRAPACCGRAVDVGRIEFLSTGTRHYFINICSIGMSCDVIQRGERFKHSKFISKLGGTLMFALSAFISLLLMTPKPLYLCKLPPRTTQTSRADEEGNLNGGASANIHDATNKMDDIARETQSQLHGPDSRRRDVSNNDSIKMQNSDGLLSLAPFAPLSEVLARLQARLPRQPPTSLLHRSTAENGSTSHPFSSLHGDSVYAPSREDSAYVCHGEESLPPPHARIVRCTTQTPSHEVQQLLDVSAAELRVVRQREAEQHPEAAAVPLLPGIALSQTSNDAGEKRDAQLDHTSAEKKELSNGHSASAPRSRSAPPAVSGDDHDGLTTTVNYCDDDLSSLTWVELPSSMVAFANGRWYGGGMHVAPHANPTDGLLSCTNWVATVLPFVSGVLSLYTGRHLRWSSTSAFDGERFLVCNTPPKSIDFDAEPLYMEADGEVLEPVPAIVELVGKITFLVPPSSQLCVGDAAPGTTRARLTSANGKQTPSTTFNWSGDSRNSGSPGKESPFYFSNRNASSPSLSERVRRSAGSFGTLMRRSWGYAQRWIGRTDSPRIEGGSGRRLAGGGSGATVAIPAGTNRRWRDGGADDVV